MESMQLGTDSTASEALERRLRRHPAGIHTDAFGHGRFDGRESAGVGMPGRIRDTAHQRCAALRRACVIENERSQSNDLQGPLKSRKLKHHA
jgi:hypothetical protein